MKLRVIWLAIILLAGCSSSSDPVVKNALTADKLTFGTPYIPAQCYTNPVDTSGEVHNPCYACHTESKDPNFFNDFDAQLIHGFPETGEINHWSNIYKDRTKDINDISDDSIIQYVREDNYLDSDGKISLSEKLRDVPEEWDRNKNGSWDGYIPDVYFNFDNQGFDQDKNGNKTGWRVFAYYPFLGTFLPTNGATDDVLIRLPEAFRQLQPGIYDQETYRLNFAIVEAMIRQQDVVIEAVDESRYGVDLNKDGTLGQAHIVKYDWAPLEKRFMTYVGVAKEQLDKGEIHIAARLYPEKTEFVHTVRYIDVDDSGHTKMALRMKELRYGRKEAWKDYYKLRRIVEKEVKERHDFPDRTKELIGNMEEGLIISQGWMYQGFIEDQNGDLRPQSYEENYFCAGCHSGIGATTDTTFAFPRKFAAENSYKEGWYHWLEKGFSGKSDPVREDGRGEYAFYLEHNPTGNEFRNNEEVLNKFFNPDGSKKEEAFHHLETDISYLLMPSAERALKLNKAYRVIVQEQSYNKGRDVVMKPFTAVQENVELDSPTGITEVLSYF